MTSFQDAPDEAIEADEAKEVRSNRMHPIQKKPLIIRWLVMLSILYY